MNEDDAEVISGLCAKIDALGFANAVLFESLCELDPDVAVEAVASLQRSAAFPMPARSAHELEKLVNEWIQRAPGPAPE